MLGCKISGLCTIYDKKTRQKLKKMKYSRISLSRIFKGPKYLFEIERVRDRERVVQQEPRIQHLLSLVISQILLHLGKQKAIIAVITKMTQCYVISFNIFSSRYIQKGKFLRQKIHYCHHFKSSRQREEISLKTHSRDQILCSRQRDIRDRGLSRQRDSTVLGRNDAQNFDSTTCNDYCC